MKLKLTLLLLAACCTASFAQNRAGDHEVSLGYGQLTSEQLLDGTQLGFILSPTTSNYANDFSSGIFSLHYKFFLSRRVAFGLLAGVEYQNGDFFYNYYDEPDDIKTYKLGIFSRTAYTIAPELTIYYTNRKNTRLYTSAGMGVTKKKETDVYQQQYYTSAPGYPYSLHLAGPETSVPNNTTRFNGYYSPIGMQFNLSGNIWGYLELGVGYKGIFNGGVTYHFKTGKVYKTNPEMPGRADTAILPNKEGGIQKAMSVNQILILPFDEPVDSSWTFEGKVTSGKEQFQTKPYFNKQLRKITARAKKLDGNVLHLSFIEDAKQRNRYVINGKVYAVDSIDALKAKVVAQKKKQFEKELCAYIVVYLPRNLSRKAHITMNDDSEALLRPNSKYIYKIRKEGINKIATRENGILNIDVKFGNTYYIRTCFTHRNTYIEQVGDLMGELESSFVKNKNSIDEVNNKK